MSSPRPLVSVIIPTNNEAERIETTLRSMLLQTYKELEILVIDDHSTDGTKAIVERYARMDSRIQYHLLPTIDTKRTHLLPHRTNGWRRYDINGGYLARNYGFTIAQGEYITLQDADDASLANRIEIQYELAQRYNATLVATKWMPLKEGYLEKRFDLERAFAEIGEENIVIRPDVITSLARKNRGRWMQDWFPHTRIPFIFKWFPLTRPLFFGGYDNYPGADNSLFFHRDVVKRVTFRQRDQRVWPNPYGRGSGRDFAFQVADTFENSWSFKLPIYLWRTTGTNSEFPGYEKYLI